ncbi:MAG: AAA family ATPase [Faecousia sp.]
MSQNEKAMQIIQEVSRAIIGKNECVRTILCAILSGGHVLIEDIPGVGKTTLALAFASAMGLEQKRIQFTPDVLPSDITGFTMYQREQEKFVYRPGAIMCNLFLADEINRTSPKTQSALLEVMEENAVTVDGVTRPVPSPFVVIATENPIGYTGTQMLPESQLDRFQVCVVMGYPSNEDEITILKRQAQSSPLQSVRPVIGRQELLQMQDQVRQVVISDAVYQYIVSLCDRTRHHSGIELGLSPRGTLALASIARANAYVQGRNYVIPKDVSDMLPAIAVHRLRLSQEAKMNHWRAEDILKQILERVEAPLPERMKFRG